MKTSTYIIVILTGFILMSVFGGIKSCQVKKYIREKTELETKFDLSQKEKVQLQKLLAQKEVQNTVLSGEKKALEQKLAKTIEQTDNLIAGFKDKIKELNSIPADTIYQDVFSKWPAFDQVLKFRFAENQVRGIYLNILERNHFEEVYLSTNKSLITCTELNAKNNQVIFNLTEQTGNLKKQVIIGNEQNANLQENIKLTEKQLSKQQRKTFFYKLTTIAAATGWIAFVLK
jgi:hypothetical protein